MVQAGTYGIAVLIVSCPCAVGLAAPMVTVIAGGVAADNGVILKRAKIIEAAHNATKWCSIRRVHLLPGN